MPNLAGELIEVELDKKSDFKAGVYRFEEWYEQGSNIIEFRVVRVGDKKQKVLARLHYELGQTFMMKTKAEEQSHPMSIHFHGLLNQLLAAYPAFKAQLEKHSVDAQKKF